MFTWTVGSCGLPCRTVSLTIVSAVQRLQTGMCLTDRAAAFLYDNAQQLSLSLSLSHTHTHTRARAVMKHKVTPCRFHSAALSAVLTLYLQIRQTRRVPVITLRYSPEFFMSNWTAQQSVTLGNLLVLPGSCCNLVIVWSHRTSRSFLKEIKSHGS